MILVEHYNRLFQSVRHCAIGEMIEISIDIVSETLFVTDRNSKLTIKKWVDLGWIQWFPGRGRGNRSKIIFLKRPEQLIIEMLQHAIEKEDLHAAKVILDQFSDDYPKLQQRYDEWLKTLFGFHQVEEQGGALDVLRIQYTSLPILPLDPTEISLRSHGHIIKQVCDTLVHYDEQQHCFTPGLAFFWEHTKDFTKWKFYLRKGVRFHDGEPFTSKDVQFTFDRFRSKVENPYRWMVTGLKEMKEIDSYTVEMEWEHPHKFLLQMLSGEQLSILSCNSIEHEGYLKGTGPFKLTQNDEHKLILEVHDTYYKERAFLDRVELWNIEESHPTITNEFANELSFGLYANQIPTQNQGTQTKTFPEHNTTYLTFNLLRDGPLKNPNLVKAVRAILHPNQLVEDLGEHRAQVASGIISSMEWGSPSSEVVDTEQLTESEIRSTLAEHYNGQPLNLYTFPDEDHIQDVNWITKRCLHYGIEVRPSFLEPEKLLDVKSILEADIIHDSATMDKRVEMCFLQVLLSENSFIFHHLPSKMLEEIKESVQHLYHLEENERRRVLLEMDHLICTKGNVLPLYRNNSEIITTQTVQNATINAQGWIDFYNIWFKK